MTETLRLEPPQYSRNYGDDVDDDMGEFGVEEKPAVLPPAPVVEWSSTKSGDNKAALKSSLLIMAIGDAANAFIAAQYSRTLPPSTLPSVATSSAPTLAAMTALPASLTLTSLGSIVQPSLSTAISERTTLATIYRLANDAKDDRNVHVVALHCYIPSDRSFVVANTILSAFTSQRVVVLDSLVDAVANLGHFSLSLKTRDPPLLRVLETTANQRGRSSNETKSSAKPKKLIDEEDDDFGDIDDDNSHPVCKWLEAPHMVHSLSASLLQWCEVHDLPAEVFLTLDSPLFVLESLSVFENVLTHYSLPSLSSLKLATKRSWYDVWWSHFNNLTSRVTTKATKSAAPSAVATARAPTLRRVPPPSVYA